MGPRNGTIGIVLAAGRENLSQSPAPVGTHRPGGNRVLVTTWEPGKVVLNLWVATPPRVKWPWGWGWG